jgi:DUF4097 and DUF4098 domain-containing protein YvlB
MGCVSVWLVVAGWGQTNNPERIAIRFSDPSRPGLVRVNVAIGSIAVKGCEGREVIVEPNQRGMKVQESDNEVTVLPNGLGPAELRISVPIRTSLQLKCASGGNILVENVDGEIEANGVNASITLRKVAGVVVAHSLQGRIQVQLDRATPGKAMSFTTLNGDVEVTLPPDTRANLKLQTSNGSIHSDYQLVASRDSGPGTGKRLAGVINGGGPEFQLKTVNGSVSLRKPERRGVEQ